MWEPPASCSSSRPSRSRLLCWVFAFLPSVVLDVLLKLLETPLGHGVQSHRHILVAEGTSGLVLKRKRRKGKQEGTVG